VIAYASRSNNNAETQYNSYEWECLATIWAIAHLDVICIVISFCW
jgi:hypothetical protein